MKLDFDKVTFISDSKSLAERLDKISLNYGVGRAYGLDVLPKIGSLFEYKFQIVLLAELTKTSAKFTPICIEDLKINGDDKIDVKYFVNNSNIDTAPTETITVDFYGVCDKGNGTVYRIWPRSYEAFIEEINFFYRTYLDNVWKENKPLNDVQLYKYTFENSNCKKELQWRNAGLLINVSKEGLPPEYYYIRMTEFAYDMAKKELTIGHGQESIKVYDYVTGETNSFDKVGFMLNNVMSTYLNFDFSSYNFKCKLVEL